MRSWLGLRCFVIVALGLAACSDNGAAPASDGGLQGKADCLAIRNCVRDMCTSTDPEQNRTCVQTCLGTGSSVAQARYLDLTQCLVNTCCTDQGGCGGGDAKCSAVGSAACDQCTCRAQCSADTAPCRQAAIYCMGLEPNCSTCK